MGVLAIASLAFTALLSVEAYRPELHKDELTDIGYLLPLQLPSDQSSLPDFSFVDTHSAAAATPYKAQEQKDGSIKYFYPITQPMTLLDYNDNHNLFASDTQYPKTFSDFAEKDTLKELLDSIPDVKLDDELQSVGSDIYSNIQESDNTNINNYDYGKDYGLNEDKKPSESNYKNSGVYKPSNYDIKPDSYAMGPHQGYGNDGHNYNSGNSGYGQMPSHGYNSAYEHNTGYYPTSHSYGNKYPNNLGSGYYVVKKNGEVHYHKHEHIHKHNHKQAHKHKHQQQHKHEHEHGHKHENDHHHDHAHSHKHESYHKHGHQHGHKHVHQGKHSHAHDHEHKQLHQHDHKHGHQHHGKHRHNHSHKHDSSHGHDHHHDHRHQDQGYHSHHHKNHHKHNHHHKHHQQHHSHH